MKRKWAIIVLALALFALLLAMFLIPGAPQHPYYGGVSGTQLIAHQGGDNVWPGNTLYAFEQAVALGIDVLETDAHITRDNQIVLMHDEAVDRTTDGTGLIEDMTLAELKQLDAAYDWSRDDGATFPYRGQGIQVPSLEEVFRKFPQMRYVIEIKLTENPIQEPLCALIRQHDMQDKVLIASFHDEAMRDFRAACPEVATSASRSEMTKFVLLSKIFLSGLIRPDYEALQPPYDPKDSYNIPIVTPGFIRRARAANLRVEPWTVDDPALMRQYIEWGIDGIMTDRPDLMMEVLRDMGLR